MRLSASPCTINNCSSLVHQQHQRSCAESGPTILWLLMASKMVRKSDALSGVDSVAGLVRVEKRSTRGRVVSIGWRKAASWCKVVPEGRHLSECQLFGRLWIGHPPSSKQKKKITEELFEGPCRRSRAQVIIFASSGLCGHLMCQCFMVLGSAVQRITSMMSY